MVSRIHLQNESLDLLFNGSVIDAAIKSYEIAWTFNGIIWLWPVVFLFTMLMVQIKLESPTAVAIVGILGNVALGSMLPTVAHPIFGMIVIFSILIWLFSLFISNKLER